MNTLWNSDAYQADLATTASNIVHLERLKDTSILITGATGLVGSYLIDTLLYANATYQLGMTIYGVVEMYRPWSSSFHMVAIPYNSFNTM